MSPNDELILVTIRKGFTTLKEISRKLKLPITDVGVYCRRLADLSLVKPSTCKTCKQTRTYIPV